MDRTRTDQRRIINKFPGPYLDNETPYIIRDYSNQTKVIVNNKVLLYINICKAIFVGDVAVGKTSLVNRFCNDRFEGGYKATVGVDFEIERFRIMNVPFNLQIWDTAGQERFRCIAQAYYRNANVVVVVFDMTKESTLASTPKWLEDALRVNPSRPFVFLVGTKRDLLDADRLNKVEEKAKQMARDISAEFWSVSSKNGNCVVNLFQRIVALSFDEAVKQSLNEYQYIKESTNDIKNSKGPLCGKKKYCSAC